MLDDCALEKHAARKGLRECRTGVREGAFTADGRTRIVALGGEGSMQREQQAHRLMWWPPGVFWELQRWPGLELSRKGGGGG